MSEATVIWGVTHCIYCEKPIAKEAEEIEAVRLENKYGMLSPEVAIYEDRFCWEGETWGSCWEYGVAHDCLDDDALPTARYRIIELLEEREQWRAANAHVR